MTELTESFDGKAVYAEKNLVYYTKSEETANTLSHFIGAVLGLASFAGVFFANDVFGVLACVLSSIGLTVPYVVSTIYHGLKDLDKKAFWRKIDHSGICFIILGCGAPLCLLMTRHIFDYVAFAVAFSICVVNVVLCAVNFKEYSKIALILDFVCAALLTAEYFLNRQSIPDISKLFYIIGSVFCAAGAAFYGRKKIFLHTVFHILMVVATTCYYLAGFFIVLS